jgi:hypothetical protein
VEFELGLSLAIRDVSVRCILFADTVSVACFLFTVTVSMTCFLFTDTVSVACFLFTDTVSVACLLFTDTVSVACLLFTDTVSVAYFLFTSTVSDFQKFKNKPPKTFCLLYYEDTKRYKTSWSRAVPSSGQANHGLLYKESEVAFHLINN